MVVVWWRGGAELRYVTCVDETAAQPEKARNCNTNGSAINTARGAQPLPSLNLPILSEGMEHALHVQN